MREDGILIGLVFAVWAAIALAFTLVPMLAMPDMARIWGAGAVLFLVLAAVTLRRRRDPTR
jgi:hypothetical protein